MDEAVDLEDNDEELGKFWMPPVRGEIRGESREVALP